MLDTPWWVCPAAPCSCWAQQGVVLLVLLLHLCHYGLDLEDSSALPGWAFPSSPQRWLSPSGAALAGHAASFLLPMALGLLGAWPSPEAELSMQLVQGIAVGGAGSEGSSLAPCVVSLALEHCGGAAGLAWEATVAALMFPLGSLLCCRG